VTVSAYHCRATGDGLSNLPIEVKLSVSDPAKGLAAFASRPLAKDDFIGEYLPTFLPTLREIMTVSVQHEQNLA
jgi:hypothetical protein